MKLLIVLPVLNEERILRDSVLAVRRAVVSNLLQDEVLLCIVDSGSEDKTGEIAKELSIKYSDIEYLYLHHRGKGLAIRKGWESFDADAYLFMDIDLATDLEALPALLAPLRIGEGIVIGSRFHSDSRVHRTWLRTMTSFGYRVWLKVLFHIGFQDAPCGFKAVSSCIVRDVLPYVEDNEWFFDSELLVRAERQGFTITEIPIIWSDCADVLRPSKVVIPRMIVEYLQKTIKLYCALR